MIRGLGAKRVSVSRKSVPKRKAGIPLDELLAARAAGDDRHAHGPLQRLGGSGVDAGCEVGQGAEADQKELKGDIARWSAVPPDFDYTVKLSRLITHRRTPGEPHAYVENYMQAIEPLRPRVANLLAQFPPWFQRDDRALAAFLDGMPRRFATWSSSVTHPGIAMRSTRCYAAPAPLFVSTILPGASRRTC